MTINLALDFTRNGADEARRSLVRFMDQVNQDNMQNAAVKFNDQHKQRLGKLVENFNSDVLDVDSFKQGVFGLYNDITGGAH